MSKNFDINIMGETQTLEGPTTLTALSPKFSNKFKTPIVLATVDGVLKEMAYEVKRPCEVVFIDMMHKDGFRTYQRSLSFLMIKAFHDVFGIGPDREIIVHFSINSGYYVEVSPKSLFDEDAVARIEERMHELVHLNQPFAKEVFKTDEAIEIFEQQHMPDKVNLLKYRRVSNINLYRLEHYYDYLYGYMVPTTGCLTDSFKLHPYSEGFVLQFMDKSNPAEVAAFKPDKMLFDSLKASTDWGHLMGIDNVAELNDLISRGEMKELVLIQEALMEKRVGMIADRIMEDLGVKKFIFIAGPSSSGKTTFAHRLSVHLGSQGLKPIPISVDNYFVNRVDTPLDEDGQYDFECLEAIDVAQFNEDMTRLLAGEEVAMPSFDFVQGERVYKGDTLQLTDRNILVVEGIHALNPKMSHAIPEDTKFKIYISALTSLNIDAHNRVPTTDARLLRRMVRDSQYRGASASRTIGMWPSVRRGEEKHIFPYQEQADVMFNSALIYELSVLKQYAEPLLFNVPKDSPEYVEAKLLIKFLDYFLGITSETIPDNSLVREFIGGSNFRS